MAGFRDALAIARAHVVGHSLGGAVALSAAERALSVTLVASAGLGPEIAAGYIDGFLKAERRKEMRQVLQRPFADPGLVTRRMVGDVLQAVRIDGARAALGRIAEACFPAGRQALDLRGRLAGLTVPAQVVWGRAHAVIPAAQAAARAMIAGGRPGSTVTIASVSGKLGDAGLAHYSASKFAAAIAFLHASRSLTGQAINLDGGYVFH